MKDIYFKQILNNKLKGFYKNPSVALLSQPGMIEISELEYLALKKKYSDIEID